MLSCHPFLWQLPAIHTWPQVTPITLTTSVTTAINTDEPGGINDLDNNPAEDTCPGLRSCKLELKRPLECIVKCYQVSTTTLSTHVQVFVKTRPFLFIMAISYTLIFLSYLHILGYCKWSFLKTPSRVKIFRNSIVIVYVYTGRNSDFFWKWRCIVGNWTCFSVFRTFHLSSKRLRQFSLTGGELASFFNSVWECPYRVVKGTHELWVSETLGLPVGRWPNQSSCQVFT